jgi:hypothetical protein
MKCIRNATHDLPGRKNDVFVDLVNNPIDHQPLANLGEWRKTYHAVKLQSLPALPVHDPRRRSNHDES